jgi:Sec-independent protein translocase protein TatA
MDILGVGPLELIFILIIALIVLGPSDMVKAGRTIGKFLRQIVTSPTWHAVTKTSAELRNLPNKLIRDAGLEEELKEIENATKQAIPPSLNKDLSKWQADINSWTTPPTIHSPREDTAQSEAEPPSMSKIDQVDHEPEPGSIKPESEEIQAEDD